MLKQLNRGRLIGLIAAILVIAFLVYRYSKGGDSAPEYQTATAEIGSVVSRVSTSGSLQAVVTVEVGTQVSAASRSCLPTSIRP